MLATATGCYQSHGLRMIEGTGGHTWRGTGRARAGGDPFAVGLTGELRRGPTFTRAEVPHVRPPTGPLEPLFSDPYYLTSVAQDRSLGFHERSWLHAERNDRVGALTLFTTNGLWVDQFTRVEPIPDAGIIRDGIPYVIRRICGLAGVDPALDEPGPLYVSVIACSDGERGCAAGLAEVEVTGSTWRVRNPTGAQQATVVRPSGDTYPADCMPIATTGRGSYTRDYVALAVPSTGEIVVYRTGALHTAAAGSIRISKAGFRAEDIVLLRKAEASSYLTVLWKSATSAVLEHYSIIDVERRGGILLADPLLTEPIPASTQFIESSGHPLYSGPLRDLYLFTPTGVYVSEYDLDAR